MQDLVKRAAADLVKSRYAIALTGAGVSTEVRRRADRGGREGLGRGGEPPDGVRRGGAVRATTESP